MAMERELAAAQMKNDVATVARLLPDDFVTTGSNGRVFTKADALGVMKSSEFVGVSADLSDMKVRVFGDAAVVTYLSDQKVKIQGKEVVSRERNTDAFVRR